jgi:F420-dependent oxidoreductase-like protein
MRFALMTEPQQGLAYEEVLALARTAESAGFEAFFRSDHYTSFPGEAGLPTTDAWTTLAGLARETSRIRLGVLVSPVTFRSPGLLAKVVTTVDEMSGGRVEVGLGAGWNEKEQAEYGFPFPDLRTRFDMLEEQLEILHGLWTEPAGWSFEGRSWQIRGAQLAPRPVTRPARRHPNLIVGGAGKPRSARLAARWADECNVSGTAPSAVASAFERVGGRSLLLHRPHCLAWLGRPKRTPADRRSRLRIIRLSRRSTSRQGYS